MKKIAFLFFAVCVLSALPLWAQKDVSVNISDHVYAVIENLQLRGIFPHLALAKPYSEDVIVSNIEDILSDAEKITKLSRVEIEIMEDAVAKFSHKKGWDSKRGYWGFGDYDKEKSVKMELGADFETAVADGFRSSNYGNKNHVKYDFMPTVKLHGDLWDLLGFRFDLFGWMGIDQHENLGQYDIGGWWYGNGADSATTSGRKINTYATYASYPFMYRQWWDGSAYNTKNISTSALEGFPENYSLGFGIFAEIGAGFFDNALTLRAGRYYREWGAMENGSSLVLNAGAMPFLGAELSTTLFKWFSFSFMLGSLEMPNKAYITGNAFPGTDDGAAMFQNMFSMTMLEANFKYAHIDFGSTVVTRKRFELGYLFPLMSSLIFQNSIGDFDNIGFFGNIKFNIPQIGSTLWFSVFLDEMDPSAANGIFSGNFLNSSRQMYAFQVGASAAIPKIPFSKISVSYSKIEPYCYTHQSINYTPWTSEYMSEAYMNNGASLGYYMPPNSDELKIRLDFTPSATVRAHAQYQFMRHGADFGTNSVRGSSIYSELPPTGRESMRKYFLHDGAYQWVHVVKIGGEYNMRKLVRFPLTIYGDAGFVYSYFTNITEGSANDNVKHDYKKVNTKEYPESYGVIVTAGIKIFM